MKLTEEQKTIVDFVKQAPDNTIILIDSVAGSGKTTLLKSIAEELSDGQGMYLAYNKAIATDSSKKFPSHIDCRTVHSLAYKAVVVPLKLRVGFFGPKHIKQKISYSDKQELVEDIKEFCLSRFTSYKEYADEYQKTNSVLANTYLDLMMTGTIECSHDFYLKIFHIFLHENSIEYDPYNLLMLDEAGDLNEVTLEIFKLLKSRIKVAVGDPHQNIYSFNYTINCFEKLENEGVTFRLSKSFRVPSYIASPIENFCKSYLNPSMNFKGTDSAKTDIKTIGYISRTNAGLINKIIELNAENTPYGLVRKAQEIFKLPLMIAGIKYQGNIYDPAYKHLQEDIDSWYENENDIKTLNPNLLVYLKNLYSNDFALLQSINLVIKYGKSQIFNAYNEAKHHENTFQNLMLMTAHSSKGLEFDEVILSTDMNSSIETIILDLKNDPKKLLSSQEKEALNLYYVACTRALVSLRNANYLVG